MTSSLPRRSFLALSAATAGAAIASGPAAIAASALVPPVETLKGRLLKTLKIGMIGVKGSLTEKFAAAKAAGFDGVELNTLDKNITAEMAVEASQAAGLPIDGTVISNHWNVRHTDPNPDVRAKALESLIESLEFTKAIGGNTALLVIGHGRDGSEEELWERATNNIEKAVPLAAELGVAIAIENVWNQFLYQHQTGGQPVNRDQTAEPFVRFVDQFQSPWVGMQFDIGNHWKYGSMGDWIRQLGKRIVKLDLKGFSRAQDKFTKIGEGDLDWADVRAALKEIRFSGWAAAEVGGGGPERLQEISSNMDRVFGLV